jgi:hypothetical protein
MGESGTTHLALIHEMEQQRFFFDTDGLNHVGTGVLTRLAKSSFAWAKLILCHHVVQIE